MLRQLVVPALRSALNAVLPAGGSAGQVLVKKSDTDCDVEWANAAQGAVVDHELNVSSDNAISNSAVADVVTWHEL